MMLTGIHVEGNGPQASSTTIRICPGLNVVIDSNANANSLGRSLRGTLFGTSRSEDPCLEPRSVESAGWIEVNSSGQSYRLTRRSLDRGNPLLITPLDPTTRPNPLHGLRELDQETFDAFFFCDLSNRRALTAMTAWLRSRMASPRPLQSETTLLESSLVELSEEIEQTNLRIRLANARRDLLDRQIIEGECRHDRAMPRATPAAPVAQPESLARLYERLDEIDCQWRSWRDVQQVIQKRRVGIRDELANAPDVAIVPLDHPWHRFRESIQTLDAQIAQMEPRPKLAHESNANPRAVLPAPWCNEIRESLHELNQLLEQQHRQSRHRMAAGELKQLRTCYQDLEKSVQQLMRRRHSILEQIHGVDPQGAELVLRGNQHFCAMAQRDGYWLAREQCLPIAHAKPAHRELDDEFSTERWQLESARQQRIEVHNQIAREESVLRQRVNQRDELVDRLSQHRRDVRQYRALPQATELGLGRDDAVPARILENASQFLRRISGGHWTRIGLAENTIGLVVKDTHGQFIDAERLGHGIQAQIAISLSLAVAQHFETKPMPMPLVMCGLPEIVTADEAQPLVELIGEYCTRGQQFIVVVRQAHDAETFASLRPHVVDLASAKFAPLERVPPMALADSHTFRERARGRETHFRPPVAENHVSESSGEPIYRFPIQRALRWQDRTDIANCTQEYCAPRDCTSGVRGTQGHAAATIESGRESETETVSRASHLRDAGVCTIAELSALERFGITTIGQLLDENPESLAEALADAPTISTQIRRWQTCCWLLICVPEMAAEDARVLYECGIAAPQQLEEVRGELLLRKLQSHLTASGRGTAFARYNVERINGWMRSLARTRPQWKLLDVRQTPTQSVTRTTSALVRPSAESVPAAVSMKQRPASEFAGASDQPPRTPNEHERESLRFHLQLNDSVDAAPSIGSRIVQQLGQIGIRTVRDFLGRTPDDIAREINNRRISAETIRQWQQQAQIACSVPNLRRHDVQILVACGISEPEQLATMTPAKLFEQVDQFLRSKAGSRLIRSGKKPDVAEVTDWIRWARHTRSVQAA